jgi:hypothetical protein
MIKLKRTNTELSLRSVIPKRGLSRCGSTDSCFTLIQRSSPKRRNMQSMALLTGGPKIIISNQAPAAVKEERKAFKSLSNFDLGGYDKKQNVLRPFMGNYGNVEQNVKIKKNTNSEIYTTVKNITPYEKGYACANVSDFH